MGTFYKNVNGNIDAQTYNANSTTSTGKVLNSLSTSTINSIASPSKGMVPFDSTLNVIKYYDGTAWKTAANLDDLINQSNVESIRFTNSLINRKIVLFDNTSPSNDHQFYGIGINNGIFRSQIKTTSDNYVWYAGSSTTSSNELMRLNGSGFLGIQNASPHAPLQFSNSFENRKAVLFENTNNDHQFLGFGTASGILRYQLDSTASSHVFYAAASSSTSNEVARITGTGFVGIQTSTPHAMLQFANTSGNRKIVLKETVNNDHEFIGFGNGPTALQFQTDSTSSTFNWFAATSSSTSNELMRLTGLGFLGIGGVAPNAPLQFPATHANRKTVLFEMTNNDHQFFGFGTSVGVLRNQIPAASSNFGWYAGASSSTSNLLMLLTGAGFLGIGGIIPNAQLQLPSTTSNRKFVQFETGNNDHQFYGFGINSGIQRYQVDATTSDHVFYAGTSSTTSNEIFRIRGNNDVIVNAGTLYPHRLPSGGLYMEANATITVVTTASTFVKVAGTTTSLQLNQFSMPANNQLTYTGNPAIVASVLFNASVKQSIAGGATITFAIFKNGTRVVGTNSAGSTTNNTNFTQISMEFPISMVTNDFLEVYVTSANNNTNVTAANLTLTATATY